MHGFAKTNLPLGVAGRPEDLAEAVLYLASPAAKFLTGQTLTIERRVELEVNAGKLDSACTEQPTDSEPARSASPWMFNVGLHTSNPACSYVCWSATRLASAGNAVKSAR